MWDYLELDRYIIKQPHAGFYFPFIPLPSCTIVVPISYFPHVVLSHFPFSPSVLLCSCPMVQFPTILLSHCPIVPFSYRPPVQLKYFPFVLLSSNPLVLLSSGHMVLLSHCHLASQSPKQFVILPKEITSIRWQGFFNNIFITICWPWQWECSPSPLPHSSPAPVSGTWAAFALDSSANMEDKFSHHHHLCIFHHKCISHPKCTSCQQCISHQLCIFRRKY